MKTKICKTCNIEKLLSEYHSGNYRHTHTHTHFILTEAYHDIKLFLICFYIKNKII